MSPKKLKVFCKAPLLAALLAVPPETRREAFLLNYIMANAFLTLWYAFLELLGALFIGYNIHKENRMTKFGFLKPIFLPKPWQKFFLYQDKKNGIFSGALIIEILGYIEFFLLLLLRVTVIDNHATFYNCWGISLVPLLVLIILINTIVYVYKKLHKAAK